MMGTQEIKDTVKSRYGAFAAAGGEDEACCAAMASTASYAREHGLYSPAELASVPDLAINLSRGCGNPTGFAELKPGEVVVDFGSGGGIDAILAARQVGPEGRVVGVDLTAAMIQQAHSTVAEAELTDSQIEFREADLNDTGLPDGFADVVLSNCVINLCPDKDAAYAEALRILRPGGRIAISDIVLAAPVQPELAARFQATWVGCLGGASGDDPRGRLHRAGRRRPEPAEGGGTGGHGPLPWRGLHPRTGSRRHRRRARQRHQHQVHRHQAHHRLTPTSAPM